MSVATKAPSVCYQGKSPLSDPKNSKWKPCLPNVKTVCVVWNFLVSGEKRNGNPLETVGLFVLTPCKADS